MCVSVSVSVCVYVCMCVVLCLYWVLGGSGPSDLSGLDAVESVPCTAPSRVSIGGVSALLCHDCVWVPPIIFCAFTSE